MNDGATDATGPLWDRDAPQFAFTRWADTGKLHPIRTSGGHRRYRASEVQRLLDEQGPYGPDGDGDDRS